MKRSSSARSLVSPAARSRESMSFELPELPPEVWMHILSFLHLCDDHKWMHEMSFVSKRARTLIFESVTEVTLSSKGEDYGIFQNTFRIALLSPSSISLLSRFPNVNRLTVEWAPAHDILKTHMSGLSNLTDLCVGVNAVVLPSSVAHPLKLKTLRLHKRTSSHWKIASTIDKGEDGGIARFVNLSSLETNSDDIFLDVRSSSSSNLQVESRQKKKKKKNVSTLPVLPNLSALKLANASLSVLNDSWLKPINLTSLSVKIDCDLSKEHIENLVSLTTLEISRSPTALHYRGASLNSLTNLKTLSLLAFNIPEEDISSLSGLTSLSLVGECYSRFFERVGSEQLVDLQNLTLCFTDNANVSRLTNLTQLRMLAEVRTGVSSIAKLTSLVKLSLEYNNSIDRRFDSSEIGILTQLRTLTLIDMNASIAKDVLHLTNLTKLESRFVQGIDYDIARQLTNLKRLRVVRGCTLYDAQLQRDNDSNKG